MTDESKQCVSERETLYEDYDVTLRRYQSGRYGLTIAGLRVVFSDVQTPSATRLHEFIDDRGEHIASIKRSDVPHELTKVLDEVEND